MPTTSEVFTTIDRLRGLWTDKFVRLKPNQSTFARFATKVGRVVTINCNGRALVDFADGAWCDVPLEALEIATDGTGYDPTVNSAQALPQRQA